MSHYIISDVEADYNIKVSASSSHAYFSESNTLVCRYIEHAPHQRTLLCTIVEIAIRVAIGAIYCIGVTLSIAVVN